MPQVISAAAAAPLLAGRIALVTGASSGIGRAIALLAAQEGADLIVTYQRSRDAAEAVAQEIRQGQRRCLVVQADVSSGPDVERLSRTAMTEFGRVDAWINNAGADILTGAGAGLTRLEKLDLLLAVDVRGSMLASWAAADLTRQVEGGAIVNMSWDGALRGLAGENPELFSAAKGAVLSYSRALARSRAPKVRVNVVAPGWIETAFGEGVSADFKDRVAKGIPLGRWGTAQDVAGAAVFLASHPARYDRAGGGGVGSSCRGAEC
jgi:3-oxoacyl-[acyl-carrier protein] reductase